MTTSPTRILMLRETIESIMEQTVIPDIIILNIPYIFKRTGERYTNIPGYLLSNDRVLINRCEDIGPATKILPTIDLVNNDNDTIISIDDDIVYCPTFIETLVEKSREFPNSAITGSSFVYSTEYNYKNNELYYDSEVAEGFAGILYKKWFLSNWQHDIDIDSLPKICYVSDDIMLSNLLKKRGINIVLLRIKETCLKILDHGLENDALHKLGSDDPEIRYKPCVEHLANINDLYLPKFYEKIQHQQHHKNKVSYFLMIFAIFLIVLFFITIIVH